MRSMLDFSSWQTLLSTVIGLLLATLLMVGFRLVFMQTIQRRRERENRQINERLRTLIAAYKTLGSSFTGDLSVDPRHKRDLLALPRPASPGAVPTTVDAPQDQEDDPALPESVAERRRRTRDAVEAALSDIILLGTEEQVRLAAAAARDMVAGRRVQLAPLVHSLRTFIRAALDLEPIPNSEQIPDQGPLRPAGGGTPRGAGAARAQATGAGGGARGGGGAGAGGAGMGAGMGLGLHAAGRNGTQDEDR